VKVKVRGCFTHTARLALQRGGGKKDSEGSIYNCLIGTMKLKDKDAATCICFSLSINNLLMFFLIQVVGGALTANYIPPKNGKDFVGFIDKHCEWHEHRYGDIEKQIDHIRKTYFNHDPRCLGGRAAGIPGQTGSNNGGEKRGGIIKTHWRNITRQLSVEAR